MHAPLPYLFRLPFEMRAEFDGETQAVCGALIPELEELHQKAIKKCEKAQKEKHKIQWAYVNP